MDGATTKAPLGGGKNREKPTDRGKVGVKRSTLIDGRGVPLALATLDAIPVQRPDSTPEVPQHLCLDKGYAGTPVDREVRRRGYKPHVPCKANEAPKPKHRRGKARRWKVERTHSWLNRARRLLIRWEKKVTNDLGFLHLQFAIVALRHAKVLG